MITNPEIPSLNFTASIIEKRAELTMLASEWNVLLQTSEADSIFLTWEWVSTWLETVYSGDSLMVVTVRNADGHLVALAPFYQRTFFLLNRFPFRCLCILGESSTGAEYPDIIIKKGMEDAVLPVIAQAYASNTGKWDWVWLLNIAGWTGAYERLIKVFTTSTISIRRDRYSFSSANLPGSWRNFVTRLPKGKASIIDRQEKRASKQGNFEMQGCNRLEDLPFFFENFFFLHVKHWQSKGEPGAFARYPQMDDFCRNFAPKALKKGWLAFFQLSINGKVQASQYGCIYNKTFLQIQEGFDPDGLPGLGNVLRKHVLCWCMDNGIREYDFLGGHSEHKASWGTIERWGWRLFLGRRNIKTFLLKLTGIWPLGRFITADTVR